MSDTNVLLTDYNCIVALSGIPCQQYTYSRSSFLSGLIPNQKDAQFIRDIKDEYFARYLMIGIHYRSHDKTQDWEVVPPFDDSSNNARKFGEGADLTDFERIMSSIQKHFHGLTGSKTVRFFIASNSEAAKDYLLSKFQDALTLRGGNYKRSSPEGMNFALLEWLLLSESALILNTYGSTFAIEAGQRMLRPTVGIWGGKLLFHSDIRLPQCGHMQFLKFATRDDHNIRYQSYTEGTVDKRTIKAKMVALSLCPILSEWGLGDVYCSYSKPGSIHI